MTLSYNQLDTPTPLLPGISAQESIFIGRTLMNPHKA